MNDQSYTTTIEVVCSPQNVFNRINDVSKWFKNKGFEGSSTELNDEFIFCYGEGDYAHYSKQKPKLNCYSSTVQGWNMIIKEWLFNFKLIP